MNWYDEYKHLGNYVFSIKIIYYNIFILLDFQDMIGMEIRF